MKKSKNLLILFLIVLILLAFYFILKYRPKDEGKSIKTSSEKTTIINLDSAKVCKIILKSNSNTLKFQKREQIWIANFTFPYKQDEINGLAEALTNLRAEQVIEKAPIDLSQYGLEKPKVTIEVFIENDIKPIIMYLGDPTPTGSSYYFSLKENPIVYTIPNYYGAKFTLTLADFRDYSLSKINIQEINYFKLSQIGKPDLEIKQNSITSELTEYGIGVWKMTKPYQESKLVASEKFQPIIESIALIFNAEEFIEDNPVDLSRYGLVRPQSELLVKDSQTQFHLLIGKPMNEQFVYCKKNDSNEIFTIKRSNLSFLNIKPFELIDKFVYIVNIEEVDKVTISGLGVNYTIVIDRKRNPNPKSKSELFDITYKVNGKIADEQLFKTIYQNLIGLLVESEYHKQPINDTPDLNITYYLNKGDQRKINIDFIPYNYDFYAVSKGGKAEFLISRDQVNAMVRELKSLIKGRN